MGEVCQTTRQTVYNSSSMLPERKFDIPNRDTEQILNSKQNVKNYCQVEEVNEAGRILDRSTILVEKSSHVRIQTSDIPSMQQR